MRAGCKPRWFLTCVVWLVCQEFGGWSHCHCEFAAVSLSVAYITMTVKKTFMVTKLTTEPAAIHGGSTPLEEKKNLQCPLLSLSWSLHQAVCLQSLLASAPCPQCEASGFPGAHLLYFSLHPDDLPGQKHSWSLQALNCQGDSRGSSCSFNGHPISSTSGITLAELSCSPALQGLSQVKPSVWL